MTCVVCVDSVLIAVTTGVIVVTVGVPVGVPVGVTVGDSDHDSVRAGLWNDHALLLRGRL